MAWLFLALAIGSEVVGTLNLRSLSAGFRWLPAAVVVTAYVVSFSLMIPALRRINVGVAYAIWSAVGTASVAVLGAVLFGERLSWSAIGGIVVIVAGVLILTASGSATH